MIIIMLIERRKKPTIYFMRIEWFFIWTNLNTLHPRMLFAQRFWRRLLNSVNVFSLFGNYIPLEKGGGFHLNKAEFPSPKNALWLVLLKLAQWFWRRRFFNFVNLFLLFGNYLPMEKCGDLNLNKLETPSPKNALY